MPRKKNDQKVAEETKVNESVVEEATFNEPEIVEAKETMNHAIVSNCERLRIRQCPSIDSEVIGILHIGDKVIVTDEQVNDFTKVTLPDLRTGYCMSKYLKNVEE